MSTQNVSQLIAPTGVNHASMLQFMREQETHVSNDLLTNFLIWVDNARTQGQPVDEALVQEVTHDLQIHHRLTPETIINAPHAPYISLNHTEDYHFGRE